MRLFYRLFGTGYQDKQAIREELIRSCSKGVLLTILQQDALSETQYTALKAKRDVGRSKIDFGAAIQLLESEIAARIDKEIMLTMDGKVAKSIKEGQKTNLKEEVKDRVMLPVINSIINQINRQQNKYVNLIKSASAEQLKEKVMKAIINRPRSPSMLSTFSKSVIGSMLISASSAVVLSLVASPISLGFAIAGATLGLITPPAVFGIQHSVASTKISISESVIELNNAKVSPTINSRIEKVMAVAINKIVSEDKSPDLVLNNGNNHDAAKAAKSNKIESPINRSDVDKKFQQQVTQNRTSEAAVNIVGL